MNTQPIQPIEATPSKPPSFLRRISLQIKSWNVYSKKKEHHLEKPTPVFYRRMVDPEKPGVEDFLNAPTTVVKKPEEDTELEKFVLVEDPHALQLVQPIGDIPKLPKEKKVFGDKDPESLKLVTPLPPTKVPAEKKVYAEDEESIAARRRAIQKERKQILIAIINLFTFRLKKEKKKSFYA